MSDQFQVSDLVARAHAGDEQAAAALYAACRERMLPIIRAIMPLRLRKMYDSDDFVQEGMINLLTAKVEVAILESPARFWPYIKRVVENKVRDVSRKYLATGRFGFQRETAISDNDLRAIAASIDLSIEDTILLKDLAVDHLNEVLNEIPIVDRPLVILLIKGYSFDRIANRLNVSPAFILNAIERIKSNLAGGGLAAASHAAVDVT